MTCGEEDIAVNFIILPRFFNESFFLLGNEESPLRNFIIGCLTGNRVRSNYLYYNSDNNLPIQNLLENQIWNLLEDELNKQSINQYTMGLLFLNLINHSDQIVISQNSFEQSMALKVLSYIESSYRTASLSDFADKNGMNIYTLSRIIKKQTGQTFKSLLENKRLNQACFLLKNASLSIAKTAYSVGYENISFFYRLFKRAYDMSPKEYRLIR